MKKHHRQLPPRPAEIRRRYAGFLAGLNRYMEHYRQALVSSMNAKHPHEEPGKPPVKAEE